MFIESVTEKWVDHSLRDGEREEDSPPPVSDIPDTHDETRYTEKSDPGKKSSFFDMLEFFLKNMETPDTDEDRPTDRDRTHKWTKVESIQEDRTKESAHECIEKRLDPDNDRYIDEYL